MNKPLIKKTRTHERGQAIILVAFALVGLVAMVGLVTDTGMLLIQYGNLKRGVDAGAIAAAQQYSLPNDQLTTQTFTDAATNFINLNKTQGVTSIDVHSCITAEPSKPALCNASGPNKRKVVEVTATADVPLYFLGVVGIKSTTISASAIGEAATMDIVLVIDTSASMAYETRPFASGGNPFNYDADASGQVSENPEICNNIAGASPAPPPCQPLDGVKRAALAFINTLNFGFDRVGIVALTGQQSGNATRYPVTVLPLTGTKTAVETAINGLKVFTPRRCDDANDFSTALPGICIVMNPNFSGVKCELDAERDPNSPFYDPSSCPSSNVGGALRLARSVLAGPGRRLDSYWVALVLMSGPANATDTPVNYPPSEPGGIPVEFPNGYCPASTYYIANGPTGASWPYDPYPYKYCTDGYPTVRHTVSAVTNFTYNGSTQEISIYDPDDYARDQADALAKLLSGTGVTIYTIGLGEEVNDTDRVAAGEPPMAKTLLEYIALSAGGPTVNHGQYFYAPTYSELTIIFDRIAENIATKISQ